MWWLKGQGGDSGAWAADWFLLWGMGDGANGTGGVWGQIHGVIDLTLRSRGTRDPQLSRSHWQVLRRPYGAWLEAHCCNRFTPLLIFQ